VSPWKGNWGRPLLPKVVLWEVVAEPVVFGRPSCAKEGEDLLIVLVAWLPASVFGRLLVAGNPANNTQVHFWYSNSTCCRHLSTVNFMYKRCQLCMLALVGICAMHAHVQHVSCVPLTPAPCVAVLRCVTTQVLS